MSSITEQLQWHDAGQRLPDSDITVVCWGPDGFFTGWWADDCKQWIDCASGGVVEVTVTHWAEPKGPAC